MVEALPNPGPLTVRIKGGPVGTVAVDRRYPRKVFGVFTPGPGLEPYRPVFENAVELARQYDGSVGCGVCDYPLWDRLMAAYAEINRLGPVFAELPAPIEEFAIESDWSVEITFEVATAASGAPADRPRA
jgi:hypothetical protein